MNTTPYQRGDRIALVRTADPYTRLQPGDTGTVSGYDPALGQLSVRWDSGSTLAMLLNDGDRVRLITPVSEAPRPAPPQAMLRQAADLGRWHGKAAAYWQIGDSGSDAARGFYRDLLRGIAAADPEVMGLYEMPALTVQQDYDRDNLAGDLGLARDDPLLAEAALAYLAAAREEFWLQAARLARRRLHPGPDPKAGDADDAGLLTSGPWTRGGRGRRRGRRRN